MRSKDEKLKFEEDLVKEVRDDFFARQKARKNLERQWQLNMNFLIGNQYCNLTDFGEIEDFSKQYFWQEREVFNHIAPIMESRIAKLVKIRPALSVIPSSGSEQDVLTAKLSKKLLTTCEHNMELSKKIAMATNWSEICGTSFYKIVWNSDKGSIIGLDANGVEIKNGDVDISVCSPFEIFPDNNTTENIEDLSSIIHAVPYKVEQIENIWKVKVEPEDVDVLTLNSSSVAGGLGYTASVPKMISEKTKGSAIVIERYEAPSKKYPNGRVVVVAGNKLLAVQELPFLNKQDGKRGFPFIKQCSLMDAGSFWGISVIERLIPIQRSYNAIKNRKHEFLNRIAMGILTVEDGSVDIANLEEEGLSPGKVLVYRQGSTPPSIMENNQIPYAFEVEEERLLQEFVTISGITDYSITNKGYTSKMSAVALELLIEQESDRLSATSDQIKHATIQIGKHILRLYKQFATQKRLNKIEDENGKIELFYWNKSDISSDDVVLDTTNEIGETLSQRRNMVFELLKAGILTDENGKMSNSVRQKTLQMLGFGTWQDGNDLSEIHSKKAGKENLVFIQDFKNIDVLSVDDHNIHISAHTAFLLSQDLEKLADKGAKLLEVMLQHINQHKTEISNETNSQN